MSGRKHVMAMAQSSLDASVGLPPERLELVKRYSIEGFFPEAKAHHAEQLCSVRASSMELAAKLGLQELRSRPGLKGKQLETVRLTIRYIGEVQRESHEL